jgi:hypothetical protein
VQTLAELGKDEDADGIKSWLRSQHAQSIRERKRALCPEISISSGRNFTAEKSDLDQRHAPYQNLAEQKWSSDRLTAVLA